jgi:hypothetical protein
MMNLHPQASSAAVKIQETLGEKMAKHHMRGAQEPQRRHTPWELWDGKRIHRIGWRENLQENPIFDGKNHGFL